MKQRSASLDHSANAHRRHMQHRATVAIRGQEFDDDDDDDDGESTMTNPLIDISRTMAKRNSKGSINNNVARL
ncbi:unnamed protein product [Rotaria magnacalcarata]|nr:unnamed protein product [Rotaria magnacalcarata]